MKIKLRNGKQASESAIVELEAALGFPLSGSFRNFLKAHNGAEPETNIFRVSNNNDSGVNEFIPIDQIPKVLSRIENIPGMSYPVAWVEGGNVAFVDEGKGGAVFFWDHELPEKPTELAASFDDFLNLLEPFDIKTIKLKPGQVKKVWVDPEFLKRLKETN